MNRYRVRHIPQEKFHESLALAICGVRYRPLEIFGLTSPKLCEWCAKKDRERRPRETEAPLSSMRPSADSTS